MKYGQGRTTVENIRQREMNARRQSSKDNRPCLLLPSAFTDWASWEVVTPPSQFWRAHVMWITALQL